MVSDMQAQKNVALGRVRQKAGLAALTDSGAELAAQTVANSTVSTRGDIGHTLDAASWDLKALSYSRAVDAALGAALVTAWRNAAIGAAGYLVSRDSVVIT
ncbi:hypothetical protein [Salinispora arenicola]|uniref:hypothetical protein n=1 Tax=Salinispora arenicola TaxID=168697 RepID=UPI0012F7A6ED|nr:hypothetical protein [Salinispora arenicola]